MLVMVVFFIAFRWIHLSTPLIRLFLLVLILLLMPTLNFLPVWFALSLLRLRLPSRLPMMFIPWMVAMMVVIIPSRTVLRLTSFPLRRAIRPDERRVGTVAPAVRSIYAYLTRFAAERAPAFSLLTCVDAA